MTALGAWGGKLVLDRKLSGAEAKAVSNPPDDQDSIFVKSEGDAWFRRNAGALSAPGLREHDLALELALSIDPPPKSVLEVGCATGWRLDALRTRIAARCVGVDVSALALREGARLFEGIGLIRARASALPISCRGRFDAVIASFVFHWIDRRHLLRTAAEVDRCLSDGGWLVIADFFPETPTKVPYHHLKGPVIYTFKQDYSALFAASGLYKTERTIVFDHDDSTARAELEPAHGGPAQLRGIDAALNLDDSSRAAAWLLRKNMGATYSEADGGGLR